ncbi:Phage Tail Collar Domain protein [Sporomusa ovata DSM 2662]|uniref:phage tail protein n=1 Tax=Sporomusa ovata TaxID=2378 RepID=UPI0003889132|nr:tail fiber protein [Sporomusa ovata]EQB25620.1 phage tail collar domain containing protein [Sporomusa ovata DSM 2662]
MDPILGQIQLFPFQWNMVGWMPCEGQVLQIVQNQALFALLGNIYGGDGRTTFAIPNLKGSEPNPATKYYIATQGIFPQRD